MVDFDLHGILGIRLIDPTASDTSVQARRFGTPQTTLHRDPDIIIRFQENLPVSQLTYLGLNSVGFTHEGFYVLSRTDGKVKARIPFEQIGDQCEIVCRSGLRSVPLLEEIVNFTLLRKNYLPLHASAFVYEGTGILVTGWSKGGKTETLLTFAKHGAHYVGDEWIILSSDGRQMFGLAHPVTIWDWQFNYIPELLPPLSWQKAALFRGIHLLDALLQGPLQHWFRLRPIETALYILKQQLKVVEQPETIFAGRMHGQAATLDKVILTVSHSQSEIRAEACQPQEVAQRMAQSNAYEQMYFFNHYHAFKFAFPGRRNEFLETVQERQSALLQRALAGKEAYKVLHPYPVSFEALFNQLRPLCAGV
jgi:hypothetical protein